MALSTFVIINNITNLSDARFCAGMGADVLGFTLEPGLPNSVPLHTFKEITGWVAGVKLLGDFGGMEILEINQLAEETGLDFVQLNRLYPLAEVEQIVKPVVMKVPIRADHDLGQLRMLLEEYFSEVEYFLLETEEKEISHETLLLLHDLAQVFPVVLGSGLNKDNILKTLSFVQPAGICLKGGEEIRPGLRDFDELADMLELLQPEE